VTISNLLLLLTVFVLFFVMFGNAQGTYLEHAQVPLYAIIVTEIALILGNRIFKNPLIDILNLVFVVFFLLRVPFIYGDDLISDVILRDVNVNSITYALYVLGFQLIVLASCLIIIKPARVYYGKVIISNAVWRRVLRFTSLILFINIVYVAFAFKLGENNLPSLVAIFFALFNWSSILILLVPLLLFVDKNTNVKNRIYLYSQLSVCVLLVMYTGSKSGIFQIAAMYLVSLLAIHGSSYRVPFRSFIVWTILLITAVVMFLLGDIFNHMQRDKTGFDNLYDLLTLSFTNISVALNRVSCRLGYFDFYIDKLTQEVYASAFHLKYYVKAFVNAVTPGFDVFDDANLVSRAVFSNYFGKSDGPNSEVITVFAEAHHLFGYFSFIAYSFVLSVILVLRKYAFHFSTDYGRAIQSIFICCVFFRYMLGMGIDYWLFGEVIYPFIFVTLSFKFMGLSQLKITN